MVTSATLSTVCSFRFAIFHSHFSLQMRQESLVTTSKDTDSLLLKRCRRLLRRIPWVEVEHAHRQDAALRIGSESGIPRCILVISDRSLPVLLSTVQSKGWSLRYNHADNFGVVCDTRQVLQEAYDTMAKAMNHVVLQVHGEVRPMTEENLPTSH